MLAAASQLVPQPGLDWVNAVRSQVPLAAQGLLAELTVLPIPVRTDEQLQAYSRDILSQIFQAEIGRQKSDLLIRLQNTSPDSADYQAINQSLMELERRRRALNPHQN